MVDEAFEEFVDSEARVGAEVVGSEMLVNIKLSFSIGAEVSQLRLAAGRAIALIARRARTKKRVLGDMTVLGSFDGSLSSFKGQEFS